MDEFGEIYRTLFPQVYRYLLALCRDPELAEELTQETFFQGIQHIEAFRGECRLYVWLCQIGKRQYFSWLRRQRSRRRQYPAEGEDRTVDPEAEWLEREAAEELRRGLEEMEEPYREVCILRFLEEKDTQEIAQILGRPKKTVETQLYRARAILQKQIKEVYSYEKNR